MFESPVDPRLKAALDREEDVFAKAAPLWDMPVELVEIPFEDGITLPGVFVRTIDGSWSEPRKTIVHVNGYDSNVHEMFAAHVPAAVSRGYNILLFDGPGQGRNLIRHALTVTGRDYLPGSFSRWAHPSPRMSSEMDAPCVYTAVIVPSEIRPGHDDAQADGEPPPSRTGGS